MSLYGMRDFKVFEVHVRLQYENLIRDEFGWVEGYAPGNGKYLEPETEIFRIIARRKEQAEEKALNNYKYSNEKNIEIIKIEEHKIDALILEIGY